MHKHCVPCFWTNSTAKPRGSAFSLLVFHFVGLFKYAENVKMSYKGVKLNPFEVLITGWRCFVWFLKPFQFFFFEAVNVYRKQESYADVCHLTTYTQCKPNLFNLSLIHKQKKKKKNEKKA